MLILKTIERAIAIYNCINVFVDDSALISVVKDNFEGRCVQGCYVLEVKSILRTGELEMDRDDPSRGIISVVFEVLGLVYAIGEVITNCLVKRRDEERSVVCTTEYCNMIVLTPPLFASVAAGQRIAVRVSGVRYGVNSTSISVVGEPYAPLTTFVAYKIAPSAEKSAADLADVLARIEYEEEQLKALSATKLWKTFHNLLYAYKTQHTPVGKLTSIADVPKGSGTMYIGRDPRADMARPEVSVWASAAEAAKAGATVARDDIAAADVIRLAYEDYCDYLRILREFCAIYADEKAITAHNNLWQIYGRSKK